MQRHEARGKNKRTKSNGRAERRKESVEEARQNKSFSREVGKIKSLKHANCKCKGKSKEHRHEEMENKNSTEQRLIKGRKLHQLRVPRTNLGKLTVAS